jgi:hypothetical protein
VIWLAAAGGGAFILVSLVLGLRLLALSRRTRQLPELTMGLCLLLMGGLGYPFAIVGRAVTALPDDVRGLALGGAGLCNTIGFAALSIFTWRVFRPASIAAELGATLAIVTLLVLVPAEAVWPGLIASALSSEPYPGLPGYLRVVMGIVLLYWASLEAALFARKLRRRLALGLADVVVADRVRLWTIAISGAALSTTTAFALSFLGIDLATSSLGAAIVGVLGLVSAVCAWLAFLPPARYTRWVRARTIPGAAA